MNKDEYEAVVSLLFIIGCGLFLSGACWGRMFAGLP